MEKLENVETNSMDVPIKNVSFVINPGESIAFVGRTGSGNTTIINLINSFIKYKKEKF